MRQISDTSLAKLQQQKGTEPVLVVEAFWSSTLAFRYSDRRTPETVGKLLEVANLENVVDVSRGSSSQSVTVTLDDTDGSLKQILNNVDIHKRPVIIKQWFSGIPYSDAFVIMEGVVSSPISWKESDRTLTFDVVTKLEDLEVGFSADEGQFTNVPIEMVGKPWPLAFGTVINLPTLQLDPIPSGATRVAIGVADRQLQAYASYFNCEIGKQLAVASCLSKVGAKLQFDGDLGGAGQDVFDKGTQFQQRAEDIRRQVASQLQHSANRVQNVKLDQVRNFDLSVIPIINGRKFIQNTPVGVRIGDAHYQGVFHGDEFHVISRRGPNDNVFAPPGQTATEDTGGAITIEDPQNDFLDEALFGSASPEDFITGTKKDREEDPCGPHNLILPNNCGGSGNRTPSVPPKEGNFSFLQAGSPVKPDTNYPIRHIANIIPGTQILGVAARRSFGGVKALVGVPSNLYTISDVTFGSVTAKIITLHQPLSSIADANWEDEIFVTLTSPVGPNTVDIIQYIIGRWGSGATVDPVSFAAVRSRLANYPSNFALFDKRNILDLLKDIAYQARCMIWLDNGVFHLKYLPAADSPVDTFTESDVVRQTLEVTTDDTEEIVTKYVATWKVDYSESQPNKLILRNNLAKYGLRERTTDFFIYNQFPLVEKGATFWIIRLSNTFKKIKFKSPLKKLRVETLDTVTLNFTNSYVANGPIDAIVEKAEFDPKDWTIAIEAWVPVRFGEMKAYPNALPADNELAIFPIPNEDFAGSVGVNSQAGGDLATGGGIDVQIVRTNNSKGRAAVNDTGDSSIAAPTSTTIAGFAPPGIGTTVNDVTRTPVATTQPRYETQNKTFQPLPRPQLEVNNVTMPGKILSKQGANPDDTNSVLYSVAVFPDGLNKDPTTVNVIQLQEDTSDEIKAGTWTLVTRQTYVVDKGKGSAPELVTKHYMQVPVWTE